MSSLEDLLNSPEYQRRYKRFVRSRIGRDMKRFVLLAEEVMDLGRDLAERMPTADALVEYNWGDESTANSLADDVASGCWALGIAASLMSSELPFNLTKKPAKKKRKRKAKKPTPAITPAAEITLPTNMPFGGVLDARTDAERAADDKAGVKLPPPRIPGTNGTVMSTPKPAKPRPHNRLVGLLD
jgi:hypothetical protein